MTSLQPKKSVEDWGLLISLVSRNIYDVGRGACSNVPLSRRMAAWSEIEKDFNASRKHGQKTRNQLQVIWSNLKAKARRARSTAGPSARLKDPLLVKIEKLLPKLEKPAPSRKHKLQFSQTDSSFADSDVEVLQDPGDSYLKRKTLLRSTTAASVTKCPESQFINSKTGSESKSFGERSSSEGKQTGPPSTASLSRNNITASTKQRQAVGGHVFQTPSAAANTSTRIVRPLPRNQSVQTEGFHAAGAASQGLTPSHQTPVTQALGKVSSSPQISFVPTSTSSPTTTKARSAEIAPDPHTPLGYAPQLGPDSSSSSSSSTQQSLDLEGARKMYLLQLKEQQMHLQLSHHKSLFHAKMETEMLLLKMSDELRVAKMEADAASAQKELAVRNILQQRNKELHFTRMQSEKIKRDFQRALLDVQSETAVLENQQETMKNRLLEAKLKKVELELLHFESESASVIPVQDLP